MTGDSFILIYFELSFFVTSCFVFLFDLFYDFFLGAGNLHARSPMTNVHPCSAC